MLERTHFSRIPALGGNGKQSSRSNLSGILPVRADPLPYTPYEKVTTVTTVTTILGLPRERCVIPTILAMYMTITAPLEADAPGYVVGKAEKPETWN